MKREDIENLPPEVRKAAMLFWAWIALALSGSGAMLMGVIAPGPMAAPTWWMLIAMLYAIHAIVWGCVLAVNELSIVVKELLK